MTRPAPLASLLLCLALLLPAAAPAQQAPETPIAPVLRSGMRIAPRSFEFRDLAPVPPGGENLPIQKRPNRKWVEYEELIKGLKANPPILPVESFAQFTLDTTPASGQSKGELSPLAPTLGNGFEGITQQGFIPGEPTVGAGPLNIFSAGNISVTVTDKNGANRVETNGKTFFGVPAAEGAISDAQCYYDALRGRFVALCFTQGTSPNYSKFYLAISKTNDARGAWWLYVFDMTLDGATPTNNWGDYQGLGISDDKIVFSSQQFSFGGNQYQRSKFRVLDRVAAYAGLPLTYADIVPVPNPPGGDINDVFVTKPARNLTAGDNTIHCMNVRTSGGTRITYRTITGTPASPVLSAGNAVAVSSYSPPPDAVQLGSANLVATNDCRPPDFYTRNGTLIATWHTAANIGGSNVSAIRLFRMRLSDRAVLTDETFGATNTFYYYPAVTVDSVGTIFLGFGRSSSTEFPSAYASGKRRGDATIQASALLKAGMSHTTQSRWGDYTGIDMDASQANPGQAVAWYAGQFNKTTGTFGTWVNKLTFTYGQVFGTVVDDCDGTVVTTGDRAALAGATVALKQGVTTVASTTTNALGQYSFGYLESGTYDVVVTAPVGGTNVDAIAGSGATSQTRINATDVQIVMTNAQSSSANHFVVAQSKTAPVTTSISPDVRSVGDPQFTLTVNGSGFSTCSIVRVEGLDRTTTFVNASQLTAVIPVTDQGAGGTKTITVFTPTPGGGTSNGQTLTINGTPDTTPPVVTVTSPTGGEAWGAGTSHAITWTATDNVVVSTVDLALSTDGGSTFPTTLATGLANSGTFAWTVPLVLTSTARVRVHAFDGSGNVGSDSSHANFSITGWTVTASAGPNGNIAPSGVVAVADGATPAFTITPAAGYHVQDVLVNGGSVGAVTAYTFPAVHANQTIAASFAINTYTLTLGTSGSGSVAAVPNQLTYDHGTNVQVTATPAVNWNFDFWTGDASGSVNPVNVLMDGNKSVTANFGQHIYTWNQMLTGAWTTAANWTPTRTAPAANDVLIFNNGAASAIVQGVPTQTVAQILVSGNTNVSFQASGAATVTLAGEVGLDLSVAAGSTLQLTGANAITLAIDAGATGQIDGTTVLAGSAQHRLTALDANSLVYRTGSRCQTGVSFSGSAFGVTNLNSVEFQAGSLYQHIAGANPFGATAPDAVVTFLPGSRFRMDGPLTPSMSGRTYGDFEYNNGSTITATGTSPVTCDSFTVTQGVFNLNLTGGALIRGDVHVKPGATLGVNPASGTPVFSLAGIASQSVDIQGTLNSSSNAVLDVSNSAGVALVTDVAWSGSLGFTSGRIVTGSRTLSLANSSTVNGAAQGTGWVHGNFRKAYAAGSFSSTLPVGDASTYAPVAISGTGAGGGFALTAHTTAGDHPNVGTSGLDVARSLNRFWLLAPSNGAGANWSATFQYATADLDGSADPLTFVGRTWNGAAWSPLTINAATPTSIQASGLTAATPTLYAFGDLPSFTITASAGANGSIVPSGSVSVTSGTNQAFTITPSAGFHVDDVLVDGGSVGAVTSHTFNNVTANHTIAASFAGDARALTVSVVGGGSVLKNPDLPTYPNNTSVQVTGVGDVGWAFSAWSGDLVSTTNPENLLMDAAKSITATFLDIAEPSVAVASPDGGEVLNIGVSSNLTWTASDNAAVTSVDLDLSRSGAGGPWESIVASIANAGTFSWIPTSPVTSNAVLRVTARDAAGNSAQDVSNAEFSIAAGTGVGDGAVTEFALAPVQPNPVRGSGRFLFAMPREANVHLGVHDVQGRELLVLVDGAFPAGRHSVNWSGVASRLDPGLYFVRFTVPGRTVTRRFVLMR